ncbi:MAG: GvpL/GvpF family gas vesicle protein [Hyphomicrobiales bacterium]
MKDTDQAKGQYLYAIIACAEPREFKARGIGEHGDAVHTINYRRVAAVVSNSPNVEYENSRRNMMAHTLVLEEVMEQFTLLPVRFSTIAPDAETVATRLLAPRYEEFTGLLEQMRDRIELGLKAFWYEGAAFEEVVRDSETIRRMRDDLNGRSLEETYYQRIRLGEAVEKALAQKRARDEEAILCRIKPLVHKTRTNKVISDRMVVNAAFLVDRQRGPEVDDVVRKLDEEFNDRLMFKYVGPVPPYNFVNIVVNWAG